MIIIFDFDLGLLDIIQSIGLLVTIIIALYNLIKIRRNLQINNQIILTQNHRAIWEKYLDDDKIDSIFDENNKDHTTHFIRFVFLHLNTTYNASKYKLIPNIEAFEKDVKGLLERKDVREYWDNKKVYYNQDFIDFIDKQL